MYCAAPGTGVIYVLYSPRHRSHICTVQPQAQESYMYCTAPGTGVIYVLYSRRNRSHICTVQPQAQESYMYCTAPCTGVIYVLYSPRHRSHICTVHPSNTVSKTITKSLNVHVSLFNGSSRMGLLESQVSLDIGWFIYGWFSTQRLWLVYFWMV